MKYSSGETVEISGTYYKTNVNLDIKNEFGSLTGYPTLVTIDNGFFEHNWTASTSGSYSISVWDSTYKNLNANTEVVIV